jgi:hypothetical protein
MNGMNGHPHGSVHATFTVLIRYHVLLGSKPTIREALKDQVPEVTSALTWHTESFPPEFLLFY